MVVFAAGDQPPSAGIYDSTTSDDAVDASGSHWLNYIGVSDAETAAARVTELGGRMLEAIKDTPYGRNARAVDATGALFSINEV